MCSSTRLKGCSRPQRSCIFNVPFGCEFNPSVMMLQLLEKHEGMFTVHCKETKCNVLTYYKLNYKSQIRLIA